MIDERVSTAADYLASLSEDERERGILQIRQLATVRASDEDVGRPPVRQLGEYLDTEVQTPPVLVAPGLVVVGGMSVMVARAGKGKTAVSLNRLIRWAAGRPLFDSLPEVMTPVRPLRSLIIENEGAPGHFQACVAKIVGAMDEPDREAARENVLIWGEGGWSGMKIDDAANVALIRQALVEHEPDILFLEPFRGLWRGDEIDSREMANVLDTLTGLAVEHECGVMITHHERKSSAEVDPMDVARGTTAFEGHAGVMERWRPVAGARQREIEWIKTRYEQPPAAVRMEWVNERWGYRHIPEDESLTAVRQVLTAAGDELSVAEVAEELDETETTTRRRLERLEGEGKAKRRRIAGAGYRYRLAAMEREDSALGIT